MTASLLGECLAALGRYDKAEPLLTAAVPALRERRGAGDRRTRQALERTVAFYELQGRRDEARSYRKLLDDLAAE